MNKQSVNIINRALLNIGFYILLAILILVLEKIAPSGPCTPGFGFLLYLFSFPLTASLALIYLYKGAFKDKINFINFSIHTIALSILLLLYNHSW